MCAIVDANVVHQVFGDNRPPAGKYFADWLTRGNKLVAGGKLLRELSRDERFIKWFRTALRTGRAIEIDDDTIAIETARLEQQQGWESNDHHIIALANLSHARLLFTNDEDLHADFHRVHGRSYSTRVHTEINAVHRSLLRLNVCFGQCI